MRSREDYLANNKKLYEMLRNTPDLDGNLTFNGDSIAWHRNCKVRLDVSCDTVSLWVGRHSPFHWHMDYMEIDEIYEMLLSIGKKGNILVVGDHWWFKEVLYVGTQKEYLSDIELSKKKCKKYIFGDL